MTEKNRTYSGTDHTVEISSEFEGQRLDRALTSLLTKQVEGLSRARLQALMEGGHISDAELPVSSASRKVKIGEVYHVRIPPAEPAEPEAQALDLDIVYEDADLLVINKGPGVVVHPAPGNRDHTLVNALLAHCGASLSGIGGVARPGIVHRLDKDTSGLLVVAKNDISHQALTKQFSDRSLSRTYQALVWGVPMPGKGSVEAPVGRHVKDRKKMAVTAKGKAALTHYQVVEDMEIVSLLECKLATGRTHQIRVHLTHIKHPIVGDPVYGSRKAPSKDKAIELLRAFPRQALHAVRLEFIHPRTGKTMRFASELPEDMQTLLKKFRKILK